MLFLSFHIFSEWPSYLQKKRLINTSTTTSTEEEEESIRGKRNSKGGKKKSMEPSKPQRKSRRIDSSTDTTSASSSEEIKTKRSAKKRSRRLVDSPRLWIWKYPVIFSVYKSTKFSIKWLFYTHTKIIMYLVLLPNNLPIISYLLTINTHLVEY